MIPLHFMLLIMYILSLYLDLYKVTIWECYYFNTQVEELAHP